MLGSGSLAVMEATFCEDQRDSEWETQFLAEKCLAQLVCPSYSSSS